MSSSSSSFISAKPKPFRPSKKSEAVGYPGFSVLDQELMALENLSKAAQPDNHVAYARARFHTWLEYAIKHGQPELMQAFLDRYPMSRVPWHLDMQPAVQKSLLHMCLNHQRFDMADLVFPHFSPEPKVWGSIHSLGLGRWEDWVQNPLHYTPGASRLSPLKAPGGATKTWTSIGTLWQSTVNPGYVVTKMQEHQLFSPFDVEILSKYLNPCALKPQTPRSFIQVIEGAKHAQAKASHPLPLLLPADEMDLLKRWFFVTFVSSHHGPHHPVTGQRSNGLGLTPSSRDPEAAQELARLWHNLLTPEQHEQAERVWHKVVQDSSFWEGHHENDALPISLLGLPEDDSDPWQPTKRGSFWDSVQDCVQEAIRHVAGFQWYDTLKMDSDSLARWKPLLMVFDALNQAGHGWGVERFIECMAEHETRMPYWDNANPFFAAFSRHTLAPKMMNAWNDAEQPVTQPLPKSRF